jgi:hypothetical protein
MFNFHVVGQENLAYRYLLFYKNLGSQRVNTVHRLHRSLFDTSFSGQYGLELLNLVKLTPWN